MGIPLLRSFGYHWEARASSTGNYIQIVCRHWIQADQTRKYRIVMGWKEPFVVTKKFGFGLSSIDQEY